MKTLFYFVFGLILAFPLNAFCGIEARLLNTDLIELGSDNTQLSAYYDLRDRQSYIQITNFANRPIAIHVQIFQHDRNCDELNFFDDLTENDTVVYDMDNIIKNDGSSAPINLLDDSYGYVVVTLTSDDGPTGGPPAIIGNFRIVDNAGYEYRTNMISPWKNQDIGDLSTGSLIANFNTVDGAIFADVVGYAYDDANVSSVVNIDNGFSFDIFVYDLVEEPLSCDRRNFACGNVMNYGINEDYLNSRGGPLLCPGGGLADPNGGFVSFENGVNLDGTPPESDNGDGDVFVGLIGINNGNGTGSMDLWFIDIDITIGPV